MTMNVSREAAATGAPVVRIRPPARFELVDFRAVWNYRDLLAAFVVRDLKLRYRQTALGLLWVILPPFFAANIFAFLFGRVAKLQSEVVPYLVFSYTGLLAWNLFAGTLSKASGALVANASLVSKVYFPRLVLIFSAAVSALVDFAVAAVPGVALLALYHARPGAALLAAPLWLAAILLFSTGIGAFCASLAVSYRDVVHVLPVAVQMLFFASPVAYSSKIIPAGWLRTLYHVNPLAPLLEGFRSSLTGGDSPGWKEIAWAGTAAVLAFAGGMLFFRRKERQFADVI